MFVGVVALRYQYHSCVVLITEGHKHSQSPLTISKAAFSLFFENVDASVHITNYNDGCIRLFFICLMLTFTNNCTSIRLHREDNSRPNSS